MAKRAMIGLLACLCAGLAPAQPVSSLDDATLRAMLGTGTEPVRRFDAHLNDDREIDTVYVARAGSAYRVGVILAYRSEGEFVHDALNPLVLPDRPDVEVREDTVLLHRRSGGATATTATFRYRYDPQEHEMLLVGLDAERHGDPRVGNGVRLRWNLLTGAHVVEHGTRASAAMPADAVDRYGPPIRTVRKSPPVWMVDTPDVDALFEPEVYPSG